MSALAIPWRLGSAAASAQPTQWMRVVQPARPMPAPRGAPMARLTYAKQAIR